MRPGTWLSIAALFVCSACGGNVEGDGDGAGDKESARGDNDGGPGEKAGEAHDGGEPFDGGRTTGDAGRAASDAGRSADASGATGGGASASVWRPFNDQSPWNIPIGDNPPLAPDSAALISDLRTSSPYGQNLDINIVDFSIPLFYASPGAPTVDVVCDLGGLGFSGNQGENAHAQIPIPAGAAPDPESDHHLLIVDRAKNIEWGMWNVVKSGASWHCGVGATADLTGDGLRPYKPNNPTWYTSHGARACGFPLIAGLIRTEEIDAGRIEHALVVAYPHIRAGLYMSPASTAQVKLGSDAIKTRGIPCGGRIQLDPSVDLDALKLSRSGRIVAEALQRYGAFVGDYSGGISLYAENSAAAQMHWKGVLDQQELQQKIDLTKLRVLAFGKLTDDGNGD
jgi:hypothetical protein